MSDTCNIVAEVFVATVKTFGESPVPGMYVCAAAGVYAAPAAPLVCGSAAVATAVGKWATTPMGEKLMQEVASKGCQLLVEVTPKGMKLLLVEGEHISNEVSQGIYEAERSFSALDTPAGIEWGARIR